MGFAKGYTILAIIVPILALGVPIFDTVFAMVRRFVKGQPMLKPDGAHIHHRLLKRGFNQRQAVLILYTITSVLCIISVVMISADIWKLLLLIISLICFVVIGIISMKKPNEEDDVKEEFKQHEENKQ